MDKSMEFVKHFCRIITKQELSKSQVLEFFDVVQSVVPTKIMLGYSSQDESWVTVDVIAYVSESAENIYEMLLSEPMDESEGDEISAELMQLFPDLDFDFEASLEI